LLLAPWGPLPYFSVPRFWLRLELLWAEWLLNCCWPRQHSYSLFRVPRDSWPNFTVWWLWEPSESRCYGILCGQI
jgi:hypothetical protein